MPDLTVFGSELKAKLAGELAAVGRPDIPVSLSVDDASLAGLDAKIKAMGGLKIDVGVDLNTAALGAALAAGQAVLDAHPLQVRVNPDFAGAGAAGAAAGAAGAAAGGAAGGKGGGGFLGGLAGASFDLFGAVSGLPAFLTSVGGTHLALDSVAEAMAVVLPATIALGVYSFAAAGDVKALYTQLSNANTVVNATGKAVYPLTGGLARLQQAANPSVMQLFGDALSVAASKGGALEAIVKGTGDALDLLGARAALALRSSTGTSFMHGFEGDILGLGTLAGNLLGTVGNLLHTLPGYGADLLHVLVDASGAIEAVTSSGVVQGITHVALGFHGIWLWGGLAAGILGKGITAGLTGVSGMAFNAGLKLESMGGAAALASEGMLGVSVAADEASTLPWGWIAAGATVLGVLAYEAFTAKDATQQFIAGLQSSLGNVSAGAGLTALTRDTALLTTDLMHAHAQIAAAAKMPAAVVSGNFNQYSQGLLNPAMADATIRAREYAAGLAQLRSQTVLYQSRLGGLAAQFGGTAAAQGLLTASGVTLGQMLTKNRTTWLEVQQEVLATSLAYQAMGQTGGRLGSDMYILNYLAGTQYTAMAKLTSAWQQWLALSTGVQTGELGVIQQMRTLTADSHAAGASFTGVNAASITLQQAFSQQVTSLGTLQGSLMTAGAPAKVLAQILSTDLLPQIKAGALYNVGFRNQLYALAVQAGYTGRDAIAPLNAWFDQNAGAIGRSLRIADRWAARMASIPANQTKTLTFNLQIAGNPVASMLLNQTLTNASKSGTGTITIPGHAAGTLNASAGWAMVGERGPELVNLRGGEQILPNSSLAALASALSGPAGRPVAGTSGGGGMTVNNVFNGFSAQQLVGVVRQAITAASVQQGQRLRIGRPA